MLMAFAANGSSMHLEREVAGQKYKAKMAKIQKIWNTLYFIKVSLGIIAYICYISSIYGYIILYFLLYRMPEIQKCTFAEP